MNSRKKTNAKTRKHDRTIDFCPFIEDETNFINMTDNSPQFPHAPLGQTCPRKDNIHPSLPNCPMPRCRGFSKRPKARHFRDKPAPTCKSLNITPLAWGDNANVKQLLMSTTVFSLCKPCHNHSANSQIA